jgi:hypothetical protein
LALAFWANGDETTKAAPRPGRVGRVDARPACEESTQLAVATGQWLPRGPNNVIEFWIENTVMLELMTPEMTRDYVAAAQHYLAHEAHV